MKVIKSTTRAGKRYVQMYKISDNKCVRDVYANPSPAKIKADNIRFNIMYREGGRGYKVISSNTFTFTVAWMSSQGLRVETPTSSILVTL